MHTFELRVEPVQLGSASNWDIPADPALELIFEQSHEARRPAAEGEDRLWRPCRLGTDRDRGRARGFGHEQERITSRQPAERAKLVAGDEDQPSRDAAAAKIFEHPVRRVCLVRPISTCFASLVTFASVKPAARAAISLSSTASCRPFRLAPRNLLSTASMSSAISLSVLGPPGSGMRSIFLRLRRCETISARRPRSASAATVASAAVSSAASSSSVASRLWSSVRPASSA